MYRGDIAFKSSYLYEYFPVKMKMAILSSRQIPVAILLCEQFIHLTHFILRPSIQLLGTPQHAYQLFWVTSWSYSVYNIVARWVNFKENIYINMNYNYPTTIWGSIFAQMYKLLEEKYIFFKFVFIIFFKVNGKNVNNTRNTYIWVKILSHSVVG